MDIKWILFDWGNVLSQYHHNSTAKIAKFYGVNERSIKTVIYNGDMCRDYLMNGYYSCDNFLNYFNDIIYSLLGADNIHNFKPATREMFVDWMKDEMTVIDGIPEIIRKLINNKQYSRLVHSRYDNYKLGILSNTWFSHWDHFLTTKFANNFDLKMASHELGALKPDSEIYRLACDRMQCSPNEIIFFDDKEENVLGAKKYNINAHQVNKLDDIKEALMLYGIDC